MPTVHFCLVYDPLITNVTPALDSRFRPDEVVLLVCSERREQARWLGNTLKSLNINVSQCEITDAWDVDHIRTCIKGYLSGLTDHEEIALNVTGGTKPMTVAAYEVFREAEKPIFYVHHQRDFLVWMYPNGIPSEDLVDKINLPNFLMVHGAELAGTVDKFPVQGQWRALTTELIRQIDKFAEPLSALNKLASKAEKSLRARFDEYEYKKSYHSLDLLPRLKELIALFSYHKLLHQFSSELIFASEKSRFYVNGGWLEEHVFGLVHAIKIDMPIIQDLGRNLRIVKKNNGQAVENELDVALLADNKLHIIECKTKRFDMNDGPNSHGADALYKLDSLRDHMGGLQANAMLVSYKPLKQEHLWRAKDLGIEICAGKDIQNLPQKLKEWIGAKNR